jgi:hypothetical protein
MRRHPLLPFSKVAPGDSDDFFNALRNVVCTILILSLDAFHQSQF